MSARYDVCAAVVSDLIFDARVWKEARSLADAGYRVRVIGCSYDVQRTRRRAEGAIDVLEIPLGSRTGRVSLAGRVLTLMRLSSAVLRTSARAYHAHNIHPGPAAWLASRLRSARLVYDAHELYGEVQGSTLLTRLANAASASVERFMLRTSDTAITTNASRAQILRERSSRTSIAVLANVPLLVRDVEPLDPGFPQGRATLLYQGGIYARERSFRETIFALPMLDDFDLVVIGFGRDDEIALIRRWAAEAGVAERVHLLPPRPFQELVRSAALATVGLVPIKPINLGSRTGDPNKLFEYLMAGVPVVASDLPEIRPVVTQGDPTVGELFDPYSSKSLADAVRRVVVDPDRYEARRREARRLALERYNWRIEERALLHIYEKALGSVGRNGRQPDAPRTGRS